VSISIAVSTLLVLCLVFAQFSLRADRQSQAQFDDSEALALAESAIHEAAASLLVNSSGDIGSQAAPVRAADDRGLFWVAATQESESEFTLRATALVGAGRASIEAGVARVQTGAVGRSLFSNRKLDLRRDLFVDSFDSAKGSYASQATNKVNNQFYAGQNGDVGTNGELRLHKDVVVHGDAYFGTGAKATYKDDPSKTLLSGELKELPNPILLPPVFMPPAGPSLGKLHLHGDNGNPAQDLVLGPGQHHFEDFKIHKDADVVITGPADIVVDDKLDIDSKLRIDDTHGSVNFYVGNHAKIKKDAQITVTSGAATGVFLVMAHPQELDENGKKKLKKHKVKIEATFTGVIYAPQGKAELKKDGEVFGSLMANEVKFKKGARFHYDEALSRINSPFGGDEVAISKRSWRVVNVEDDGLLAHRGDPFALLRVERDELPRAQEVWEPKPFTVSDAFNPWGPDSIGWDETEDVLYDDPEDNANEPDELYPSSSSSTSTSTSGQKQ
jgi:hypothetical protein